MAPAAPAPEGRARRDRKQVERVNMAVAEKPKLVVKQGAGVPLGEIENVAFRLEGHTRKDKMLKGFYRLLYRTAPKEQTLKAELRQFSGFAYGEDTAAERAKDEMKLNDWLSDSLGELGELLDLHAPRSGTKQSKIEKILDFLATPGAREGATSLREKKEKEGAKKKRKAERAAKAKGSKKAKAAPKKKRAKKVAADEEEEEEENDDEGPSDKELRKEIEAYLNTADLTKVTMKIVRAHLADKFGDLSTRREDIKRLVVEVQTEMEEDNQPLRG